MGHDPQDHVSQGEGALASLKMWWCDYCGPYLVMCWREGGDAREGWCTAGLTKWLHQAGSPSEPLSSVATEAFMQASEKTPAKFKGLCPLNLTGGKSRHHVHVQTLHMHAVPQRLLFDCGELPCHTKGWKLLRCHMHVCYNLEASNSVWKGKPLHGVSTIQISIWIKT